MTEKKWLDGFIKQLRNSGVAIRKRTPTKEERHSWLDSDSLDGATFYWLKVGTMTKYAVGYRRSGYASFWYGDAPVLDEVAIGTKERGWVYRPTDATAPQAPNSMDIVLDSVSGCAV